MRIISGRNKGTRLFSVPCEKTRPTTDFLKEVIFSVLQDCEGETVLDLFAGSGALGLEAFSRGAAFVDLVDISSKSIITIKKNIEKLGCQKQVAYHKKKASSFLQTAKKKYDLVLIDPPYNKNLLNKHIELVFISEVLDEDSQIVLEHSSKEIIAENWKEHVHFQKKYGDSTITILKKIRNKQ